MWAKLQPEWVANVRQSVQPSPLFSNFSRGEQKERRNCASSFVDSFNSDIVVGIFLLPMDICP